MCAAEASNCSVGRLGRAVLARRSVGPLGRARSLDPDSVMAVTEGDATDSVSGAAASRPRVIAVLGMHRSGTSWLAGSLEARGLPLGEVNEASPFNAKGNRENPRMQALHAQVFADSGGSWVRPPARAVWTDATRAELRAVVADMDERFERWGFKDPRSVFVLDGWRAELGDALGRIGVFRHPDAVIASLVDRGKLSVDRRQARRMWLDYNTALVAEHRREPFPILAFDTAGPALSAALDTASAQLGLGVASGGEFFERELVHNAPRLGRVPRRLRAVWDYLCEHAVGS